MSVVSSRLFSCYLMMYKIMGNGFALLCFNLLRFVLIPVPSPDHTLPTVCMYTGISEKMYWHEVLRPMNNHTLNPLYPVK